MATFVSLLPHTVTVQCADGSIVIIEPSGSIARCSQREEIIKEIDGIEITRQAMGDVTGLPEPKEGVFLIVSRLVASACPERRDLLIPGPLIRDEKGVVIGCKGLSIL